MLRFLFSLLALLVYPAITYSQAPSAAQIRGMLEKQNASYNIQPEGIYKVENRTVWTGSDSIKVRIYYPGKTKKSRIIFNIHGGALVGGDLDSHENISRVLSNRCDAIVVALDYRKPPEAPYPAGLDDCSAVLDWIQTNAKSLGGNKDDIVLLGDSGGGLFALSLQIRLHEKLRPTAIAVINPAVDLRGSKNPMYQLVTKWYLNDKSPNDSIVSPILANHLSFFPPTLIITSEKDELKQQAVDFNSKLVAAGVRTSLFDLPGQDHLGGLWAVNHPEAQAAVDQTVRFINSIEKKK